MTQTSTSSTSAPLGFVPGSLNIAILDRGHVIVGDVTIEGDWLVISKAQTVRRWGTTRGLGEIAAGGPTANTILDDMGTVRSPLRALIGLVACEAGSWKR